MSRQKNKRPIDSICGEQWVVIPGYERYMVSSNGRLFGFCQDAVKTVDLHKGHRYYTTRLIDDNDCLSNSVFVHRLVAMAFCRNDDPDHKTEVHHINGDTLDNRACNLMWVTPAEHRKIHSDKRKQHKS